MTLTLNQPWSNICTAYQLIILDICVELFVNPTRGSKDIERKRIRTSNTFIQCLAFNFDLDVELTLVKHTHCTLTHYTFDICADLFVNPTRVQKIYRADTIALQTDRQTDRQRREKQYVSPFYGGRQNYWNTIFNPFLVLSQTLDSFI